MRLVRGVRLGSKLTVPLAVCLPKVDLLLAKNPLGGQALPWIRTLAETTVPGPLTAQLLRERSALCEQVLPIMFRGWDLLRVLQENLGNRFLFFPLTPVGLVENELGVEALAQRPIAPFGILEPLLWLLQMNGLRVLA